LADLKPLILNCACSARATHALVLGITVNGQALEANIPVCQRHIGQVEMGRMALATLPTHQPITIQLASTFPPKRGELFVGSEDMVLGCPACPATASLKPENFKLEGNKLTPSFICPQCGFHAWATVGGSGQLLPE